MRTPATSAIEAMLTALDETRIEGVKTTIPVHKKLLAGPNLRPSPTTRNSLKPPPI